uniref:Putative calcium-transporting ATPase 11 plasma membrane-type n=1 Tax=Rhizophora mucronata TaxID=61149 RepID=A0A2P2M5N8_RHIMU
MEKRLLKDFEVEHKNPSEEALMRWRKAVTIVKNRRRRFRMVADLDKRSEAKRQTRIIQVLDHLVLPLFLFIAEFMRY